MNSAWGHRHVIESATKLSTEVKESLANSDVGRLCVNREEKCITRGSGSKRFIIPTYSNVLADGMQLILYIALRPP
jgi:hypothetical protein